MGRFVPSPGFEGRAAKDVQMRRMLREHAAAVADEANRLGKQVANSYEAKVQWEFVRSEGQATGVRVVASTDDINAASWIEFGNQNLPAYAPLRKGAESAGLKTRAGRRR